MKTRCPNCQTLYDIDEATLASVDYAAVCCECHQVFTAHKLGGEDESSAAAKADPATAKFDDTQPPSRPEANGRAYIQTKVSDEIHGSTPAPTTDVPDDFNSLVAAELPDHHFSNPLKAKKRPSLMLITGVLLLALVAAAQFAWINKTKLLKHPQGRMLIQRFCDLAECELEQQRAIDKFTVLHRDLQPSISHQQALSFTLSFTNDANFSQLLPMLQLSLLDHEDKLLAQRSFPPDEYLYPATRADRSMKSKEIVNVELQLQAANLDVSGFKLEFL